MKIFSSKRSFCFWSIYLSPLLQMSASAPKTTTNEDEDLPTVENIEQLLQRMSKYDPCVRPLLVQHHLKKFGIKCTDERLVKLFSLSFETMVNRRWEGEREREMLHVFFSFCCRRRCDRFLSIVLEWIEKMAIHRRHSPANYSNKRC